MVAAREFVTTSTLRFRQPDLGLTHLGSQHAPKIAKCMLAVAALVLVIGRRFARPHNLLLEIDALFYSV